MAVLSKQILEAAGRRPEGSLLAAKQFLAQAGIAEAVVRDRLLSEEFAMHKDLFWRATDADEQPVDYLRAISGNLQVVPIDAARQALESDGQAMTDSGMPRGEIPSIAGCWRGASWRSSAIPSLDPSPEQP